MGETTGIAWTDATFNPVIGCMKVSAGCDHCYAEQLMDKRHHRVSWGQRKTESTAPSVGTRVRTSAANWAQPLRWAKAARNAGKRTKVFCASLSDVFDNQWALQDRADLWGLIEDTRELDWLLLTKRPENILDMLPPKWDCGLPRHIWLGTTCEDQAAFDKRWPILKRVPARVRFISYEPAIGPLTMAGHAVKPDWLICGGESGQGHRAMQPHWAYRIMDECEQAAIPFFMKQMSGTRPASIPIPQDLMVRQFPIGSIT
jgi:protein gp37